MELKKQQKI